MGEYEHLETERKYLESKLLELIYVNPSNNGNLQSSQYKNLEKAIKRTPQEFLKLLIAENNIAKSKKAKK